MNNIEILIKTPTGETIELTLLQEHLTRLSKSAARKNSSPQRKESAERMLACYLQALCDLKRTDLQILWYIKNMPLRTGLIWTMLELLRKQYETGYALKNLDDTKKYSPFVDTIP